VADDRWLMTDEVAHRLFPAVAYLWLLQWLLHLSLSESLPPGCSGCEKACVFAQRA